MAEIVGEVRENLCSSFIWSIPDFFSLSQMNGVCCQSPNFKYGGATWCLKMYPNGDNFNYSGWITAFLVKLKSECLKHVVTFTLGIRDKNGGNYISDESAKEFIGNGARWGWNILPRSQLQEERSNLVPENGLTISCTLSIDCFIGKAAEPKNTGERIGEDKVNEITDEDDNEIYVFRNPRGVDKFFDDFGCLFLSKEDSDVILKVKEREFPAHKVIIGARSPVFRSMFRHDVVEANTGVVEIPDCDPDVFEAFLFYLYSIKMKNMSVSTAVDLFTMTDKYDVPDLNAVCVEIMIKEISLETFCDLVTVALLHNVSKLLEACREFFTKNMKEIIKTVQWQLFITENPISANELYINALKSYRLIAE